MKVLLIIKEEKELLKGTFMGKELSTSLGGKLITAHWLLKTDKLAGIMGFLAWTNSTTLTTWKTEESATSYLGIT